MSPPTLTMRELHRLARERLGPAAAALKTRDELERALDAGAPRHAAAVQGRGADPRIAGPPPAALITANFFQDPPKS